MRAVREREIGGAVIGERCRSCRIVAVAGLLPADEDVVGAAAVDAEVDTPTLAGALDEAENIGDKHALAVGGVMIIDWPVSSFLGSTSAMSVESGCGRKPSSSPSTRVSCWPCTQPVWVILPPSCMPSTFPPKVLQPCWKM